MAMIDITPERTLIVLPGVQRYARASDGLVVTPVLGTVDLSEALLGTDGATGAEFPVLRRPRGWTFDGGDLINLGNVGSFAGPGQVDRPFSVASWVQYPTMVSTRYIWRKGRNFKVDSEWDFSLHGALEEVYFHTHDGNTGAFIGRSAPLQRGMSRAVCATYDGSAVNGGFRIYDRTGRIDDADDDFLATYTGMIDAGADLMTGENFLGDLGSQMVFDFELSAAQAQLVCWRLDYIYGITP